MISWLSPFSHDTITFYCSKCLTNQLSALFTYYGRQNKSSCLIKSHWVLILVITHTYFSNFIDFSGFITFRCTFNKPRTCFRDSISLAMMVTTLSSLIWAAFTEVCTVFWTDLKYQPAVNPSPADPPESPLHRRLSFLSQILSSQSIFFLLPALRRDCAGIKDDPDLPGCKSCCSSCYLQVHNPTAKPMNEECRWSALLRCRTERNWFWWPRTRSEAECVCILLNPGTCHHCFRGMFNAECLAPQNSSNAPAITYFSLECVSAASSAAYVHAFPVPSTAKQLQRRFLGLFQGLREYLNTSRESRELNVV